MRAARIGAFFSGRLAHIALAVALIFGVLGSSSVLSWRLWSGNEKQAEMARAEHRGVTYLEPLVHVLDTLTQARSSAVRGEFLDVEEVRSAVAAMAATNDRLGAALHADARWEIVEKQINGALTEEPTGAQAYQGYAEPISGVQALIKKVRDTSQLILDPDLVTYYLGDAVSVRIPAVLVSASQVGDLTYLGGDVPDQAATTQIAVARQEAGQAAHAVNSSIHKSVNAAADDRVGRGLIGALDSFRISATEIAPVNVLDPVNSGVGITTGFSDVQRLHKGSMNLVGLAFGELSGLLTKRVHDYAERNTDVYVVAVCVLATAGVLSWRLLGRPRRDS